MRRAALIVVLILLSAAGSLSAATLTPVTDGDLVRRADAVVVATVTGSASRIRADRSIVTDHTLAIEQLLKGHVDGSTVTVTELGGFADGKGMLIPGAPTYAQGDRVIAFLRQRPDGSWFTASMALGKFRFSRSVDGTSIVAREREDLDGIGSEAFAPRPAQAFVEFVRESARGAEPAPVRQLKIETTSFEPATEDAAHSYVLYGTPPADNKPIRWAGCESGCNIGFLVNGSQPGVDSNAGISAAMSAWNDESNSFVNLLNSGTTGINDAANDGQSVILLNSSTSTSGFCDGALGCGLVYFGLTHTFQSETWYSVESADIVIRPGALSQTAFEAVLAHELGHGLAFRHSDAGTPFSNDALMNSNVNTGGGAQLRTWDAEAVASVYGAGLPCSAPNVTGTSGGGTVPSGQPAFLSVSATGSAPLSYHWYRGASGDTSQPVGTNSPHYTTPVVNEPMSFWVKVTNSCGLSPSNTINVQPEQCFPAVLNSQPQSSRITPGNRVVLSVQAGGSTPLHFQWYEGAAGVQTKPVGTNSASFQSPILNQSTSYWVQVTNDCGTVDSSVAVITVAAGCIAPAIAAQPSGASITTGNKTKLTVAATGDGPLTYEWYRGNPPDTSTKVGTTSIPEFDVGPFPTAGAINYWVKVKNACGEANSAAATVTVACQVALRPIISAPPAVPSTHSYEVSWTGNLEIAANYELQESTTADFTSGVQTFTVNAATKRVINAHANITADTRFYYRVRAINDCSGDRTAFSDAISTVVTKPLSAQQDEFSISVPLSAPQSFTQDYLVEGFGETATVNDRFTITSDSPWLTVFPNDGALSAGGTTVQMTIDPSGLTVGTTMATLTVTRTQGSGKAGVNATTPITPVPISISRVTPVTPQPRQPGVNAPGTLIIPALAHADGFNSRFQSDVRITNAFTRAMTYELTYTPSAVNGTQSGKRTTLTIDPNETKGLNDIVKAWYGAGVLGEGGVGTLEIRPISVTGGSQPGEPSIPLTTVASSRTYNVSATGTLGQFIPAIALSSFIGDIGKDPFAKISLQQVAQSSTFRTNLGFVEGTGEAAEMIVRLFDGNNAELRSKTLSLAPYEHKQIAFATFFPETEVADGRVEVQVTSTTGKVTAYASVLDNKTSDPLLVFPVQTSKVSASRFVVPGVAELNNGAANFHTDMRIYNAATTPTTVQLQYYPSNAASPAPKTLTLAAGEVKAIDNILPSLFELNNTGGAVAVITPNETSVIVTARTYSRNAEGGTYGQFIPAVSATDAVGLGERNLEVLQLEDSTQFRSNLGLVEVTGNETFVEVSGYPQGSRVAAIVQVRLAANEFVQLNQIFPRLGFANGTYNGRVSVKVIGGNGRVAGYGSVVDNRTQDPTYVPAQ